MLSNFIGAWWWLMLPRPSARSIFLLNRYHKTYKGRVTSTV